MKREYSGMSRRRFVAGAASAGLGGAALASMPSIASGQSFKELKEFYLKSRKASLTLAWLAQGNTSYSLIAKEKGFWKKRGLDVEISRGFGSTAAVQVMGASKFNFGLAAAPAIILGASKGLELIGLGPTSYNTTMGIGVLADSDIKTPKDLEGKRLGQVITSVEVPFMPSYAKLAGFDLSKVELIHMDSKVLEQALIQKSIDAFSGTATSSLPKFVSRGIPLRFMLFQDHGLDLYGITVVTQKSYVTKEPQICQDFVDGLFEGIKFTLLNPEESMDIFFKLLPEHGITKKSRDFTKLGFGMWQYTVVQDEAKNGGLGWANPKRLVESTDLIMKYVAKPGTKRPNPEVLFTNRFAGNIKLTAGEWAQAERNVAPYAKFVQST